MRLCHARGFRGTEQGSHSVVKSFTRKIGYSPERQFLYLSRIVESIHLLSLFYLQWWLMCSASRVRSMVTFRRNPTLFLWPWQPSPTRWRPPARYHTLRGVLARRLANAIIGFEPTRTFLESTMTATLYVYKRVDVKIYTWRQSCCRHVQAKLGHN